MSVTTTTHYGLKKPDINEAVLPDPFNDNAEVIDKQMYENSVLTGTTPPTTSTAGAVGQFYVDTATKVLYQCMTQGPVYMWEPVTKAWRLLQSYTTAGSYNFTVPEGISHLVAVLIGGGGSGAAVLILSRVDSKDAYATGGASGYVNVATVDVTPGETKSVVVGAGGHKPSAFEGYNAISCGSDGTAGGTSSFDGIIAQGGEKGAFGEGPFAGGTPPKGGQIPFPRVNSSLHDTIPFGGNDVALYNLGSYNYVLLQSSSFFISRVRLICAAANLPDVFNMAAGGSAYLYMTANDNSPFISKGQIPASTLNNGKTMSPGIAQVCTSTGACPTVVPKGTDPGCGGGGTVASAYYSNGNGVHTGYPQSADGCDGAVYIFGR